MVVSMTGYGQGEARTDAVAVRVEIRSVNHRFCDVQVRVPRAYLPFESRVAAKVKEKHRRGRVEVTVHCDPLEGSEAEVRVDTSLARQYLEQLTHLKADLGLHGEVELGHLLGLDGVVKTVEVTRDTAGDWPVIETALEQALDAALRTRMAEGRVLARDISGRLDQIAASYRTMETLSSPLHQELEERLERRVSELLRRVEGGEVDRGRMLQEVAYLVDRSDVTEELTRLGSHIAQLRDLLGAEGEVGKRIEFLLQEMVRETNTIGSKTSHREVLHHAMLIKVELEKIREQVQNIE